MPAQRSSLWTLFTRDPTGKTAKCSLCNQVMSVEKSTYSNLRRHIMRKHPSRGSQVAPRENILSSAMWKHFTQEPDKRAKCRHCGTVLTYKYTTSSLGRHMQNKHPKILSEEQKSSENQFQEYEMLYEVFPSQSEDDGQYDAKPFDGSVSANESEVEMEGNGGLIELQPVKNIGLAEPIKLEIVDLNPEPKSNEAPEHDLIEGSIDHESDKFDETEILHHQELEQHDDLAEVIEETVIGQIVDPKPTDRSDVEKDQNVSAGTLISSSMKDMNTKVATFAVHTALEMEDLAIQQRIIAQKLISDILFNAKLDNLDENSMVLVRVGTFERE
uniref:BED-type domain-containing protein n=1 Tax=Anopheles epiroticus TaxID=199890 RepID=A0A182P649_9DIPT